MGAGREGGLLVRHVVMRCRGERARHHRIGDHRFASPGYARRVTRRPLYFPIKAEALRMEPGLTRFGADFGNGAADRLFFPHDDTSPRYIAEKARVLAEHPGRNTSDVRGTAEQQVVAAATRWFSDTLRVEGHDSASTLPLSEMGGVLAEDFVVFSCPAANPERAILVHVCFPSGWRPELILGWSFLQIHDPVPDFDAIRKNSASLVGSLVRRGPYIRFVWTISADDELDHHPEEGRRLVWSAATDRAFLRVERQLTVPLPDESGFIFLIRTYLHAFRELSAEHRSILARALELMPPDVVRYKHLAGAIPRALALLLPTSSG